jgi:hypothetical protein
MKIKYTIKSLLLVSFTKEINSTSGQLDMSRLSSGSYLLNITTVQGTKNIKLLKK